MKNEYPIILKNLIENNKFKEAYELRSEIYSFSKEAYFSLCHLNFGNALFRIEQSIFSSLNDLDFIEEEDIEQPENNQTVIFGSHNDEFADYERDYFNAMTDGNLGEYDDFNGSIDDIDTWARG